MGLRFENISELMNEWKDRHRQKKYSRFVYDGIVNEDIFSKLPLRICYVLKECYITESDDPNKQNDIRDSILYHKDPSNYKVGSHHWIKYINEEDGDYTYDLVKNIDLESNWYMWHRVEHLTNILWKAYLDQRIKDEPKTKKYNNRIAVIDLKKSKGNSKSDYHDILKYASEDQELLLQEMELINANVFFFGGTFEISKEAGLINKTELELLKEFDVRTGFRAAYVYRDAVLIDAYHPAYPGISYEKNDEVMPDFIEIFRTRI